MTVKRNKVEKVSSHDGRDWKICEREVTQG